MEDLRHFAPAYKFCSAGILALIVKNKRLRFSRADTFNDIFELSPFLVPLDWNELCDPEKIRPDDAKLIARNAFERICSSLYITCFSKSYLGVHSQLMWAHYADSHKGVCFCIDFSLSDDGKSKAGCVPVCVRYVTSLLEEREKRTPESPDLPLLFGAFKSDVWSYEEEVRLVIETESFDKSKLFEAKDQDGKVIEGKLDFLFNPECISKVIFGLNSGEAEIRQVVESFFDIGHIPDFVRLDLDPLSLAVVEKDLGIKALIEHQRGEQTPPLKSQLYFKV